MNEKNRVAGYRDLKVWQLGMEITERIYHITNSFPSDERFGLTSQMRRAAVSVPANIAEGHARGFTKDYVRFLAVSVGSLAEVETFLELSIRLGFGKPESVHELIELISEERRMLRGLQRSLRSKL